MFLFKSKVYNLVCCPLPYNVFSNGPREHLGWPPLEYAFGCCGVRRNFVRGDVISKNNKNVLYFKLNNNNKNIVHYYCVVLYFFTVILT